MYHPDLTIVKCSKCDSLAKEHVRQGNVQFERCLSCGHEGVKSNVYPPIGTGEAYTYKPDIERKF